MKRGTNGTCKILQQGTGSLLSTLNRGMACLKHSTTLWFSPSILALGWWVMWMNSINLSIRKAPQNPCFRGCLCCMSPSLATLNTSFPCFSWESKEAWGATQDIQSTRQHSLRPGTCATPKRRPKWTQSISICSKTVDPRETNGNTTSNTFQALLPCN